MDSTKKKNNIFKKRMVHDFGEKILKFFQFLRLAKIYREKVFDDVLDRKQTFKDEKNICL